MKRMLFFPFVMIIYSTSFAQDSHRPQPLRRTSQIPTFTDVTISSGVITEISGTHGAAAADINNDDLVDLYINSQEDYWIPDENYKGNFLFMNNGDGTFSRMDDYAGVQDISSSGHTPMFFDMDRDGDFDLAIGHSRDGLLSRGLFRNDGNASFTQINEFAGFETLGDLGTRSIIVGDLNGDSQMDIQFATFNNLDVEGYIGDGTGLFSRDTSLNDNFRSIQGMTAGDIDNDGDLDVFMGNYDTDDGIGYYQNDGSGRFTRVMGSGLPDTGFYATVNLSDIDNDGRLDALTISEDVGTADIYRNSDSGFVLLQQIPIEVGCEGGCGGDNGAFGDFDNDGDPDLFLPTGTEKLWLNDGSGAFFGVPNSITNLTFELEDARFPVLLDHDDDGDLDIFVAFHDAPSLLLRNNFNNNNYIRVRLTGPSGEKGGFGSKVSIYRQGHLGDPDHLLGYQEAMASGGYCIQHEPVLHFGLGSISRVDIQAEFIDGTTSSFQDIPSRKTVGIVGDVILSVQDLLPSQFVLEQNFPNPFNPETEIRFSLAREDHVQIRITDLTGREVKVLTDRSYQAGSHVVIWDGSDSFGKSVSSGVYFYRFSTTGFSKVRKMMLLH